MDKNFLEQLNKLKNIKPDSAWKRNNREILFSQISNSYIEPDKAGFSPVNIWKGFVSFMSQPATVVISLIVLVAGFLSFVGLRGAQPGNSLYIAKIISEKTKLAITFDESEKERLTIKYASDHAKEITRVLADPSFDHEKEQDKKQRLTQDFKKEISSVREKISVAPAEPQTVAVLEPEQESGEVNEEDIQVFSADFKKDSQGVEVSTPSQSEIQEQPEAVEAVATSTQSQEPEEPTKLEEADKALEEAQKLFDSDDFNGALTKIEEAQSLLEDKIGEVKGVSEEATSSEAEK